ncbi:MAG TPA: DUF4384 domain-containing protein [Tenuifilaceae bacterium]|nr:DUF4384 domain-containing protein [Tenuifilaceae bacterium]HOZ13803.1 DUF4384 domain-containing protein [Tenuifilaceae bacterium]HPN21920.1 DUF4384 domain-containing protein [Tenuifilaceae bacterium]HPV57415.1 DUF4384 domain-containing protein [Tenuifilaceae bacterium]HSA05382.1 DUF4384 domain-containing protein [Tenuifilaceae bacterium]
MKPILILFIASIFTLNLYSQDITRITGAKGRQVIVGSINEDEAKNRALAEAKLNALKMAGGSEHIQAYDMLYKSEIGNKYDEVFMSDVFSEIRGGIKKCDIISSEKGMDEQKNFFVEVTIDADIVLYSTGPDPAFMVNIDGIKQGYQNGEKLKYTVTPTMDCYLNIFNIYENNASVIFPNEFEKSIKFKAEEKKVFPLSNLLDGYVLEKSAKDPEKNKLLFVFTKEKIPYINYSINHEGDQITSFEDVSSWLFSISPDKRVNYFVQFVIY